MWINFVEGWNQGTTPSFVIFVMEYFSWTFFFYRSRISWGYANLVQPVIFFAKYLCSENKTLKSRKVLLFTVTMILFVLQLPSRRSKINWSLKNQKHSWFFTNKEFVFSSIQATRSWKFMLCLRTLRSTKSNDLQNFCSILVFHMNSCSVSLVWCAMFVWLSLSLANIYRFIFQLNQISCFKVGFVKD